MKVHDFIKKKQSAEKIVMVTCYDYPTAKILAHSEVDVLLVGDSVSMLVHGYHNTTKATMEMMIMHTKAVARGNQKQFIVADLPFLSYRKSQANTVNNVQKLMQAGAHAVKLEGSDGNLSTITHLTQSGVPVMGHLGLTPQLIHTLGGYKIQGRQASQAQLLLQQAQCLEEAGCFAIVLECVPLELAKKITDTLRIPTIGIGAGPDTDGQVLVWHDILGLQKDITLKFSKTYLEGFELFSKAIGQYVTEVKTKLFPEKDKHSFL